MEKTHIKIPRNILIVSFVAFFSGFGQDLISSVLPGYLTLIGMNLASIGLIDGLLQGTTAIFRFISGVLSDRFKQRKSFIFLGYALSSIARPLIAIASGFPFIAALRIADGAGKGMKDAPRDALIADSSPPGITGRSFGFQRLVDTAGSVFGPLLAAGLLFVLAANLQTYRLIFALAAIPGAIALGLIWFGVKEKEAKKAPSTVVSRQPFPWRFWVFVAAMTIVWLTKINDALFLVRANDIGIPRAWVPVLFAGFTLLYALLSYPIGIWSDRWGKWPFITIGWLVLSLVELGFAENPHIIAALALFAGYGLFYALTEGSGRAYIADLVQAEARGSAYAVFYTFIGLATIVGGFFIGHLWDTISPHFAFQIAAGGTLLGTILLLSIKPKASKSPARH